MVRFYLESLVEGGTPAATHRRPPAALPRRPAGRARALALVRVGLEGARRARRSRDGSLRVRDLGSKNGTFVNSERVGEARLREGDILHFAHVEFRVGRLEIDEPQDPVLEPATVALGDVPLPEQFVEGARELPELLEKRQVSALFQPIVACRAASVAGYEALGRGRHPRLPEEPLRALPGRAAVGAEAELSRLFRETAPRPRAGRGRASRRCS